MLPAARVVEGGRFLAGTTSDPVQQSVEASRPAMIAIGAFGGGGLGAVLGALAGMLAKQPLWGAVIGAGAGVVVGGIVGNSTASAASAAVSAASGSGSTTSGTTTPGGTVDTSPKVITLAPGTQSVSVVSGQSVVATLPAGASWGPQIAGQNGGEFTPPSSGSDPYKITIGGTSGQAVQLQLNWLPLVSNPKVQTASPQTTTLTISVVTPPLT